jgi:iron complex transport system permease protein
MQYLIYTLSFIIIVIAPFIGQVHLEIIGILDAASSHHMLFWELRLPRVFIAFFSGAILSLGGLVFQAVFRNPLTTPFTLGVASGATLGAAIAIIFLPASLYMLSYLFSFLGAFLTIIILFVLSSQLKGTQTNSLLLIGIALSFFYSAFLMVLYYISDFQQSYSIMRFTMGSLNIVGFDPVYVMALSSFVLLGIIYYFKQEFKLILTSYENAFLKGIEIKKINLILLLSENTAFFDIGYKNDLGIKGIGYKNIR